MEKEFQELLTQFQCDYNRIAEETFAQTLAENEKVRLFFINENQAFTDGRNVVVDPGQDELFADRTALDNTGDFLGWPKVVLVDPWNALRIITRAQTIHECLHLLYTDFPPRFVSDPKFNSKNKKAAVGMIANIIEDSYIEAVGCSYFDNMEFYLKFGRVARLFANHPSEGTVNQRFGKIVQAEKEKIEAKAAEEEKKTGIKQELPKRTNGERLVDFLNHMATFLLYPMVRDEAIEEDIIIYVEAAKPLFLAGSVAASPKERYEYSSKIYDLVQELIPPDNEEIQTKELMQILGGTKTHDGEGNSIGGEQREGRSQSVSTRLFTGIDGKEKENKVNIDELMQAIQSFAKDKNAALQVISYEGSSAEFKGSDYDCAAIHKNVKINESHPKIDLNMRLAYQNIYNNYKINIRSYNSRFTQLLKAQVEKREEKFLYGSGITVEHAGTTLQCGDGADRDLPDTGNGGKGFQGGFHRAGQALPTGERLLPGGCGEIQKTAHRTDGLKEEGLPVGAEDVSEGAGDGGDRGRRERAALPGSAAVEQEHAVVRPRRVRIELLHAVCHIRAQMFVSDSPFHRIAQKYPPVGLILSPEDLVFLTQHLQFRR